MHEIVAIAGSFGAMHGLLKIVAALPAGFPGTLLIVTHIGARKSVLAEILGKSCSLPVRNARDGEPMPAGMLLLAPPDCHMMVSEDGHTVRLYHGPKENHSRPAIDPLFRSGALAFGKRAVGVVLTGYLDDGVAGLAAIKAYGGMAIVQDPAQSAAPSMPSLAMAKVAVDLVLAPDSIGVELVRLVTVNLPAMAAPEQAALADASAAEDLKAQAARERLRLENRLTAGEAGMQ